MASEKLLENLSRAKEEVGKPAKEKPAAGPGEKNSPEADAEVGFDRDRFERLLAAHGIPDKEKFLHKREQLYLMIGQGLSDAAIGRLIGFSSRMIDRLRMVIFMAGEEYLLRLLPKEEPDEEQVYGWITRFVIDANPQAKPADSSVEKSLDVMGRHMVRQQEIASAQVTRLTEYIKQMSEISLDRSERDILDLKEERRKERENMQRQIDLLNDENFRLTMKMEDERQEREEEKKAAAVMTSGPAPDQPGSRDVADEGYFARRRRVREKKEREDFIAAVLRNGEFSSAQLAVVNRVVGKGFTLEQLRRICDPKVRPENMELLEAYYERGKKHA